MDEPTKATEKPKKSKSIAITRTVFVISVIIIVLIIIVVGLLAGLLGKRYSDCEYSAANATALPPVTTTEEVPAPSGPWSSIRLPGSLVPYHYVVDLQPNLTPDETGLYRFNGSSQVEFTVIESTRNVVIHSSKLNYTAVSAQVQDGTTLTVSRYWLYEPNQYLVVELDEALTIRQNYTLKTEFFGELATDLTGIYRSSYLNKDGVEVSIATSQMQSGFARKTFPCFDEPALKATFDVYLWHKYPYNALSNMPLEADNHQHGDWYKAKFNRTVRMSTYLLAFVVSDFIYVESFTSGNPKIQTRIFSRPEQATSGNVNYAKRITPTILDHYADYFGVAYPLPKSDQIAVPDFGLGAMENWGLIIYAETRLLFDPAINAPEDKVEVARLVAHELSHQWFGNIITPLWWDELWLNEGFATYIQYIGVNEVEPSWRMNDRFVVRTLHTAMSADSLTTSRPIVALNVNTIEDINALFDDISYSKGGCIIRMLSQFVGERAFRLGLKNYLEEHAYGSVTHNQLFQFWEEAVSATPGASNPPGGFVSAMDTWVLQMGYPTITVKRHNENPNKVVLTQERFLLDPEADINEPPSPLKYLWVVPFWYIKQSGATKPLVWLQPGVDAEIDVPSDEFIIGNYEVFGYYRVNYDAENWQRITDQLNSNHSDINAKSRGQIIDDAFNLARAGKLDYATALGLLEFLRNDYDYIPWKSAVGALTYLQLMLGRSEAYGVYSGYLLHLVQPLYNFVGLQDADEHLPQLVESIAFDYACTYGNTDCVTQLTHMFQMWKSEPASNEVAPHFRSNVYCLGVALGGSDDWNFIWEMYVKETNAHEKFKLQHALTCSRLPWIINRLLGLTKDGRYVRKQDGSQIIIDLCYNEYARDITWDFLRQEWDFIYDVYGTALFAFRRIIEGCTSHFSTQFELDELRDFKSKKHDKLGSGLRAVDQAIEKTKTNIQWRIDNEQVVFDWLLSAVSRK